MNTFNILIAGVGGQGVILASGILADAALNAGLDVKQSEVHGMAQRGGSVLSQVRFGDKVFSPVVSVGECDLLIGFEPLETARYLHFLKGGGAVVYNTHRISTLNVSIGLDRYPEGIEDLIAANAADVVAVDATAVALQAGNKRAINLVLLGAAMRGLPLSVEMVKGSMERHVPPKALAVNRKAFALGMDLSRQRH
jgi:indolepyruvate ferredoxin oxidoreductase beta subunit